MRLFICSATILLSLVACSKLTVPGVEIDSRLKGYILPKSKVLAAIDFEKIKQTDFFKRHQTLLDIPQLNQLPAEIGMDPRRDLSSFLLAWNGTETLLMTRGSYAADQLEKHLGGVAKVEKFNSYTLYGDGNRDVVFLPKGIALLGPAVLLKKAVNEDAAGAGGISEGIQAQLARVNKSAQMWAVSSGVIPLEQMPLSSNNASVVSNISDYINGTTLALTLSTGIGFDAHISCISEEGSKRVHDALRGVIGLARLSTKDDQIDQLKIWDSIKVDQQAKEVHVTADFSADMADKAIDLFKGSTSRLR